MTRGDPVKQIRELRRLLDSYREGFPILKELVQNAEDAQSTCLDYGWLEGLSNANHPLLKAPALFFINNGKFDKDDARSLFFFDVSGKSDQEGTIGKFGLGLKSVFHLCEAFFYLAPSLPKGSKPNCNIFNPWEGSDCHNDWDEFTENDQQAIKKCLNSFLSTSEYQERWFIIWIPLRQECHKTQEDKDENGTLLGTIKPEFFENQIPDFLIQYNYFDQISSLLPNLHSLKIVRYWEDKQIKYQATNIPTATRVSLIELEEQRNQSRNFQGQITINKNSKRIYYFGNEIILEGERLLEILNNNELKLVENTKKIKSHCAIIFSRICQEPDSQSYFKLRLATFLPIPISKNHQNTDEIIISCLSPLQVSYDLTLHGYFFVNSSRTEIKGWEHILLRFNKKQDSSLREQLEIEWNSILYDYLLSNLLDSLSQFVSQQNLLSSETEAICQSLKKSDLFNKENLKIIYGDHKYICRIKPDGITWELVNISEKILNLPDIPDWKVFSYLKELSKRAYFTLPNKPNLVPENNNKWESQEILDFLQSLDAQYSGQN